MINVLWLIIIIISISYALITGNLEGINNAIINTPKGSFKIITEMSISIIFWSGFLNMAKESGFLKFISKYIKKIIRPLFKEIPYDSEALDYISMNVAANFLGLGSASTPMGLKAMEELDKLNNNNKKISKSMITLITLNIMSFSILPTTILSIRNGFNSKLSVMIIPYLIICSGIVGIISLIINYIIGGKK